MTRYEHLITTRTQVVDARRDVLRAVHDHARQHGHERRAAIDPEVTSAPALGQLEWTVNGYTLWFGVLLVTGGRLGDIFGRRRMFLLGVIDLRDLLGDGRARRIIRRC